MAVPRFVYLATVRLLGTKPRETFLSRCLSAWARVLFLLGKYQGVELLDRGSEWG